MKTLGILDLLKQRKEVKDCNDKLWKSLCICAFT